MAPWFVRELLRLVVENMLDLEQAKMLGVSYCACIWYSSASIFVHGRVLVEEVSRC